ncbi:MAG: hypothetical protein M3246_02025 [Actinomycetota bacterium]|nr:hypothetical protein [Actinomycetota bacterium]
MLAGWLTAIFFGLLPEFITPEMIVLACVVVSLLAVFFAVLWLVFYRR